MKRFKLSASSWVPAPIDRVFEFFSRAANLERLTPPFLNFHIVSSPSTLRQGSTIDYRLSLHGIPIRWRSAITAWDPPRRFVDEQVRGPYRLWRHTHAFEPRDDGTLIRDEVEYATWGGALVNRLFVAPDLRRIFRYRQRALSEHFGGAPSADDLRIVAL